MTHDVVEIAQELIQIPSVNPMGHTTDEKVPVEEGVTTYLKSFCESRNLPYEIQDVAPGRQNVLAMLPGKKAGPVILLDAHQDTVPVEGMVIDPFAAKIDRGRLWGRGACDVKGGMAAILGALDTLTESENHGTVLASFTCDEEHQQWGAQRMVAGWEPTKAPEADHFTPSSFPRPDLAVITEPTQLDVVVAHRGVIRWTLSTEGQAAHSSQPELGTNAIYRMAQVVRVMEEIASTLGDRISPHPLCGPATLSVGTIHGGSSVNVVPDACEIHIDRRLLPGEVAWVAHAEVSQRLADELDFKVTASEPWCLSDPLVDQGNESLAANLGTVARQVSGAGRPIGVSYGTHAPRFAAAGIPTVVFGPGNIQQAHTKNEWIELQAMHHAVDILVQFCRGSYEV